MIRWTMDNIASLSANNGVLSNHYDQLVSKFGSNPQASQWRDQQTQIRRFEILCKNVPRSL